MIKKILTALLLVLINNINAQSSFTTQELSLNGFRNPSIGAEYRYHQISVHAGYYTTAFKSGVYTNFIKTGITFWFLPVGNKTNPSSFYAGLSYARGINEEYKNINAGIGEVGFRWMAWKGLNLRLGVAALFSENKSLKINPTPGISYSFFF